MQLPREQERRRAFTLTELVVILLTIALLFLLLVPLTYQLKQKSQRITCVNNLKNMGLAFRIFSTGNSNLYPMQKLVNAANSPGPETNPSRRTIVEYFQSLANELSTPVLLLCPADARKAATGFASLRNENISYFLGVDVSEKLPTALLVGDRNLMTNSIALGPGVHAITAGMNLGWTKDQHRFRGNVALGDGSVQQCNSQRLTTFILTSGLATNRIALP
ncbi:MAG: type II secretion system protein [Verrucomicrobia bacterium]|nr:type II secretion system protein [Verrucomicrobiota bacterium]